MARPTHEEASAYVLATMRKLEGLDFVEVIGTVENADYAGATDVDIRYRFIGAETAQGAWTVWVESDGSIYGEW